MTLTGADFADLHCPVLRGTSERALHLLALSRHVRLQPASLGHCSTYALVYCIIERRNQYFGSAYARLAFSRLAGPDQLQFDCFEFTVGTTFWRFANAARGPMARTRVWPEMFLNLGITTCAFCASIKLKHARMLLTCMVQSPPAGHLAIAAHVFTFRKASKHGVKHCGPCRRGCWPSQLSCWPCSSARHRNRWTCPSMTMELSP